MECMILGTWMVSKDKMMTKALTFSHSPPLEWPLSMPLLRLLPLPMQLQTNANHRIRHWCCLANAAGDLATGLCCFGILTGAETSWAPFFTGGEGLLLNFMMEKFGCWGGNIRWWGLGCWVVLLWHYLPV